MVQKLQRSSYFIAFSIVISETKKTTDKHMVLVRRLVEKFQMGHGGFGEGEGKTSDTSR